MYHQRRGSDKRERIDADLEDILAVFDALDAKSSVPPIYCEATELPKIPSLSLDPVSEQVQDNTRSLLALTSAVMDLEKKLSTFLTSGGTRSEVKKFLVKQFCLSMYGGTLWYLSCKNLRIIECALNKTFRRIRNLPPHSHTRIVHCVSNIQSVSNMLYMRLHSMLSRAVSSLSPLVKYVFKEASQCAYSFTDYNFISGHRHIKMYSSEDMLCAEVI